MIIVPFLPMHLEGFEPQDMQKEVLGFMSKIDYGQFLFDAGEAYSLVDGDVIACGGVYRSTENRGTAWAVLSKKVNRNHMVFLTKQVIKKLRYTNLDRIEAIVDCNFVNGNRWVKILGMKNETPDGMESFYEKNDRFNLYSMVRK